MTLLTADALNLPRNKDMRVLTCGSLQVSNVV